MTIIKVQSARDFRHIRAATFGVWLCLASVFPCGVLTVCCAVVQASYCF